MLSIQELHLESFKGFRDFHLTCSPLTVLVGANNSGKTSILQAVTLLHEFFCFALGGGESASLTNVQWSSNPSQLLSRFSPGDPTALWLDKKTSHPCSIAATFSNSYALLLQINGPRNYSLELMKDEQPIMAQVSHPVHRHAIDTIFAFAPRYVPPISGSMGTETFLSYPQHLRETEAGRLDQYWRNYLYWLSQELRPEDFNRVTSMVAQYLPGILVLNPRLSKDQPPNVLIEFEQDGVRFDTAFSGGGHRTLLNLATAMHGSASQCFLFDEPEAHLHGTLQRQAARLIMEVAAERDVQVFIATHSTEFLAEIPIENLLWIDRAKPHPDTCSSLGKFLVDLGAINNADAIRAINADKILFLEGSIDKGVLQQLFAMSGHKDPFAERDVLISSLPYGKGETKYLEAFERLAAEVFKVPVRVAAIVDNDYDLPDGPPLSPRCFQLTRKEIENYLIDPGVIHRAAVRRANELLQQHNVQRNVPTLPEIESQIDAILADSEIRATVEYQVKPRYRDTLDRCLDGATRESMGNDWFKERWADRSWQLCNSPGKEILARVRQWCQDTYKLTLTPQTLMAGLGEAPADIKDLAAQIEASLWP